MTYIILKGKINNKDKQTDVNDGDIKKPIPKISFGYTYLDDEMMDEVLNFEVYKVNANTEENHKITNPTKILLGENIINSISSSEDNTNIKTNGNKKIIDKYQRQKRPRVNDDPLITRFSRIKYQIKNQNKVTKNSLNEVK